MRDTVPVAGSMRGRALAWALGLAALGAPNAARAQDAGLVADVAQLLALEDRREYDAAALRRGTRHPEALVRWRSAMAAGRIGDRAAVPLLLPMLSDPDTTVRAEAAFALGLLADTAAGAELAQTLGNFPLVESSAFSQEVVSALARIGGEIAGPALERWLLRHPAGGPQADRLTAAVLLEAWRLGRGSPVAARLESYVRTATGEWRRNAVYSLTRLRIPAGAVLAEAAADPDPLTRSWVARSLTAALADSSGMSKDAFLAQLRQLVGDTSAQVRINALRAIATYRDSNLVSLAAGRVVDRDPNVPVQAAATLGALGGSRAATLLVERLGAGGPFGLRRAALLALAEADPARVPDVSRGWLGDADWRFRATAAEALALSGVRAARPILTELLADADPRVVAAALSSLARVVPAGDSVLRGLARQRLSHGDVMVRTAAIELLARERDPALLGDFVAAYRVAEREEMNDARLAAVAALTRIAAVSPAARASVELRFLGSVGRSHDYLVRRAVADGLGWDAHQRAWGDVLPVETGRTLEDYREAARRYVLGLGGGSMQVTIETDRGSIVLNLLPREAPLTVDNFVRLVDRRYFDNQRWHRVVPNFVVQGGDPRGDGSGGPGTVLRDEINRQRYGRGTVGMALSGPDTGGSQFFIAHSPQPHLDGGYTVFAHVVSGLEVVDQLVQGDRIRRVVR
jgi:cyclophilin family peptidyl-prolyl cis-trans isomerase/HEAT repeat protein